MSQNVSGQRTVGIILARVGSSRLPGKTVADVAGKPVIAHIIDRLRRAEALEDVVLATPDTAQDEALRTAGQMAGAEIFAGSTEDVLERLYQAAKANQADIVVHVGGDCPFVDPRLADRAVDLLVAEGADYASNVLPMTYPDGIDMHALTFETLERLRTRAVLRSTRRHPFAYLYQNQAEFRIANFAHEPNLGHLRWTLDYPEDLAFTRAVFERLHPMDPNFGIDDILMLLEREPEIGQINAHLSDYASNEPAYWHAVSYMVDLRSDLSTTVNAAVAADESGDLTAAHRYYRLAEPILAELRERAKQLGSRT